MPNSKLAKELLDQKDRVEKYAILDRNPASFSLLLDCLRNHGKLPKFVDSQQRENFTFEMKFWGLESFLRDESTTG